MKALGLGPPILILTLTILILRIVPTKSILTWKGERWLGRVESILRLEGMGEWCRLETWVPPPQGGTLLLLIEAPTPPPTSPAGTPSRYITLKNLQIRNADTLSLEIRSKFTFLRIGPEDIFHLHRMTILQIKVP
jgi:hypothetical protein